MIKYTRSFITFLLVAIAFGATAQTSQTTATTSSPYSMYGLGDISPALLPQNIGMGGIATAINRISGYNNINPFNPASYGLINYTTLDAGMYASLSSFSQQQPGGGPVQNSSLNTNFRLAHVTFAMPITRHSAMSFGLLPYSSMGYNNINPKANFGTNSPVDTNAVNYIYSGNGGISKLYLGYGYNIGKHFLIGANIGYLFGNLQQYSSSEVPNLFGTLNTRAETDNNVHGVTYDYGAQYSFDFGENNQKHLVLGYSGSAGNKVSTTQTYVVSQYTYSSTGDENPASDTLINQAGTHGKVQLPQINHFGVSFQNEGRFIVGADYTMGHWSSLSINGVNQGFQDSKTINIGGQYTPDINSLHSVLLRTDYRLGFIYDQSYLSLNNVNITTKAITFGVGLPLAPNNSTFYKINFAAEYGQRGTLQSGLVKENFLTLHLAFTVNDRWFQRFKFD